MAELPTLTPAKLAEKKAREARLAAALRGNLRLRKDQARARREPPPPDAPAEPSGEEDPRA